MKAPAKAQQGNCPEHMELAVPSLGQRRQTLQKSGEGSSTKYRKALITKGWRGVGTRQAARKQEEHTHLHPLSSGITTLFQGLLPKQKLSTVSNISALYAIKSGVMYQGGICSIFPVFLFYFIGAKRQQLEGKKTSSKFRFVR